MPMCFYDGTIHARGESEVVCINDEPSHEPVYILGGAQGCFYDWLHASWAPLLYEWLNEISGEGPPSGEGYNLFTSLPVSWRIIYS